MAKTQSTMLELSTIAPDFALPDTVDGSLYRLDELAGEQGTLIMFLCNHCPFVRHLLDGIVELARDYQDRGIGIVAISSNDPTGYPQDRPERMGEMARTKGFSFPYLYDESQAVAQAYQAACTPDFYLFDGDRRLIYRGQFDDSRPGNAVPVTGRDLRRALDSLLSGAPVPSDQKPSIGCSIKWRSPTQSASSGPRTRSGPGRFHWP